MENPVALKVISPRISHKFDVGGVFLNIDSILDAEKAYRRIKNLCRGNLSHGILVQRMIKGGKEVILGAKRDPSFDAVVLFGPGGIYVEVLRETSIRVAPINRIEAEEIISERKYSDILRGVRGERPSDIEGIIQCLLRLSQLIIDFPEIEGIDINPLIALERGVWAVDARIILSKVI